MVHVTILCLVLSTRYQGYVNYSQVLAKTFVTLPSSASYGYLLQQISQLCGYIKIVLWVV